MTKLVTSEVVRGVPGCTPANVFILTNAAQLWWMLTLGGSGWRARGSSWNYPYNF